MQTTVPATPETRRERLCQRRRTRPSKITIPRHVSPAVQLVFQEMQRQRQTYDQVEEMSGVLRCTMKAWRHRNRPNLDALGAVLGALGWDFLPVCRAEILPAALVADLEAVAAKHALDASQTIKALVALVARGRDMAPPTAPTLADLAAIGGTDTAPA